MQQFLVKTYRQIFTLVSTGAVCLCSVTVVQAEVIRSFDATVTPAANGSFLVVETITYDFENELRHGIFRVIENNHAQAATAWYKDRTIAIELIEVTRDGEPEQYVIESERAPFRVRIGDPYSYVSGAHTYTISYRVSGGLSYYENPAMTELYWNVTGHDWPVTIENAQATVVDTQHVTIDTQSCYQGLEGSVNQCDDIEVGDTFKTFRATDLSPGSGLTIAQALDTERVAVDIREEINYWLFAIAAAVLWLVGLVGFVYRYRTRYQQQRATLVQYEPYQDCKPMFTGVLFDGRLDSHDITAGIIYLAEQGYIKIKKTDEKILWLFNTSDYEVTLLKDAQKIASAFSQELIVLLFGRSTPSVGDSVKLSDIKTDNSRRRKNYYVVQRLRKALMRDVVDSGFFETWSEGMIKWFVAGFFLALVQLPLFFVLSQPLVLLCGFVVVSLMVGMIFTYRRRTQKGFEARWYLEGFKLFLSKTEKERYVFHNAPEKSPELFMEYLPYAIAFGVEKQWAKVFEDITIPDPTWYEGGTTGRFSATALTSDLGSFSASFATSSGSSGSSGGGSSGGGSGGGGGGSW